MPAAGAAVSTAVAEEATRAAPMAGIAVVRDRGMRACPAGCPEAALGAWGANRDRAVRSVAPLTGAPILRRDGIRSGDLRENGLRAEDLHQEDRAARGPVAPAKAAAQTQCTPQWLTVSGIRLEATLEAPTLRWG